MEVLTQELRFFASFQEEFLREYIFAGIAKSAGSEVSERTTAQRALASAEAAAKFAFYGFAFARAGAERAPYRSLALHQTRRVWPRFKELCREYSIGPNERQNRRVVEGVMRGYILNEYSDAGLFKGLAEMIKRTGRLADAFLHLLMEVGLGKKRCALLLRDLVWIYNLEDEIERADYLYCQPIDVWVLRAAESLFERRLPDDRALDWTISQMIAETCHRASVSGIAFNQGAWRFGSNYVRRGNNYQTVLQQRLTST